MIFRILGSGTLVPDGDRGPAGFLLSSKGAHILVDGGTGTVQRLARAGVDARKLDGAVYSHRHIDHCGDLVPILFAMCVGIDFHRTTEWPVWSGEGFEAWLTSLQDLYGAWITPTRFQVQVEEMPLSGRGFARLPGRLLLETLPAVHQEGALHVSFMGPSGERAVFSGDTGYSTALVELARGADLLVCECGNQEGATYPFHLAPSQVAAIVDQARPARVVLTHFYPPADREAARTLVERTGVPTVIGEDGQDFPLGPDAR